jgi:hypothetical protein
VTPLMLGWAALFLGTSIAAPTGEIQRVRYGPGVCGPIDPAYVKTATETGGQPFPLSTTEVGQSSRIMAASSFEETILWASGAGDRSYSIPVDSSVARLMISGTFDGTGGTMTIAGPDGTGISGGDRVEDTLLNCGRVVTLDAPASGTWQVRVAPSSRFWLRASAKSDLSLLSAEFVERSRLPEFDRLAKIQGQPIAGRPATLRVRLSSPLRDRIFQLVSLDAGPLHVVTLQSDDDREFSGTIELPREPFRVVVSGRDESGVPAQRMSGPLFHGEAIEVVPPAGVQTVAAGTDMPVTFVIRNHGPAVRLRLVASDGRGTLMSVDSPTLDLERGGEANVTVRLRVPSDAPEGEASVRVTASVDGPVDIGGFNSAAKAVSVIRK